MVKALHEADIEVILDVVYNHTAEGNERGPTIAFRGIDNAAYYRLVDGDKQHYYDTTGTGNSLLMRNPHVLQLIMDSLRYWVLEMHVDGFRFDLAATLARQFHEVDKLSAFFDIIQQDPVISQVKLIAEPWDLGDGGYQVGNFPPLWTEWNGKYRDTVRDYWRGEPASLAEFASRLTGSSDLYAHSDRRPTASVNFVIAHDGFTLRDLVSYNEKHNEANGEDNNDGESHNRSWNCGVEGRDRRPGDQRAPAAAAAQLHHHPDGQPGRADAGPRRRARPHPAGQQQRLRPGQRASPGSTGISTPTRRSLLAFTSAAIALRKAHPVLRRRRFFAGDAAHGGRSALGDIEWLKPDGSPMDDGRLELRLRPQPDGLPQRRRDPRAGPAWAGRVIDDHFLLLFNAHYEPITFTLPPKSFGNDWQIRLDTATGAVDPAGEKPWRARSRHAVEAHSMVVLSTTVVPEAERPAAERAR